MTARTDAWIALGLAGLMLAGAAAALVPRSTWDRLEETCAPQIPPGEGVRMSPTEDVAYTASGSERTVDFRAADRSATRVVLRTCIAQETHIERNATAAEALVHAVIRYDGPDLEGVVEEAEVKMRAVLVEGTLVILPRIELHGRDRLPRVAFTLVVPPGVEGHVEAWP